MSLKLESSAFGNNESIPVKYTCDGKNVSPPLQWTGIPPGTKSFAIIFDDPDAPSKTWVHWVLFNIPSDTSSLEEDMPSKKKVANGAMHGINDFKNHGYGGPCPPSGTHDYHLKLYALDTLLDMKPDITKGQLIDAMDGHILEKTELKGKYKKK